MKSITKRLAVLLLGMLCMAGWKLEAAAAKQEDFTIYARLAGSDADIYDVELTLGNAGADWEGCVRLLLHNRYQSGPGVAYDTMLALPQGSTKRFTVQVPKDGLEDGVDTIAMVRLLDGHSNVVAQADFTGIFHNDANTLDMGILSDDYSALTYLDLGGLGVYFRGSQYAVKLHSLSRDNLEASLDGLDFLVIDHYNTGILPDAAGEAVRAWTEAGGILLVGTGKRAEEVLSGLSFLDIQAGSAQGGKNADEKENHADGINTKPVYEMDILEELAELSLAELLDEDMRYDQSSRSMAFRRGLSDGAVSVFPYSLSELGEAFEGWEAFRWSTPDEFVRMLLEEAGDLANAPYALADGAGSYADRAKISLRGIFRHFGYGASRSDFLILKVIIVLYVCFAGPLLYLLLRMAKKRELYWAAVPAAALLGVLLVFLAGRGFAVVGARIYSVTMADLSGERSTWTYLHGYDAGRREWSLKLSEAYECAGAFDANFRYDTADYSYHMKKEGERLFLGLAPKGSFEDGYFVAGSGKRYTGGSLALSGVTQQNVLQGMVANGTEWDFAYFAVIAGDSLYVFANLPAGAQGSLSDMRLIRSGTLQQAFLGDYYNSYVRTVGGREDMDALAALGMGIFKAYSGPDGGTMAIGVVRDWEKAVEGGCRESAYGCLYQIGVGETW